MRTLRHVACCVLSGQWCAAAKHLLLCILLHGLATGTACHLNLADPFLPVMAVSMAHMDRGTASIGLGVAWQQQAVITTALSFQSFFPCWCMHPPIYTCILYTTGLFPRHSRHFKCRFCCQWLGVSPAHVPTLAMMLGASRLCWQAYMMTVASRWGHGRWFLVEVTGDWWQHLLDIK